MSKALELGDESPVSLGPARNAFQIFVVRFLSVACMFFLVFTAPWRAAYAQAQDDQPPIRFDAASIKLHKPDGSGTPFTLTELKDNHLGAVNAQLKGLIAWAYQLKADQAKSISGLPAWAGSQTFDIDAEAEGEPTRDQMLKMLQSLLIERFKLALHTESRETPVYALVLIKTGKLGPQLKAHSDASPCQKLAPGQPAALSDFGVVPPPPPVCGRFITGANRLAGNNVTMGMLAGNLTYLSSMDRAVIDRTGLTGSFDLSLTYTPDIGGDAQHGGSAAPTNNDDPSAPPPLITALREQLGLKLDSATAMMNVVVVDHAEEPSPN